MTKTCFFFFTLGCFKEGSSFMNWGSAGFYSGYLIIEVFALKCTFVGTKVPFINNGQGPEILRGPLIFGRKKYQKTRNHNFSAFRAKIRLQKIVDKTVDILEGGHFFLASSKNKICAPLPIDNEWSLKTFASSNIKFN